jgi:glycosyltransferase involved in cell wall biosynthesis
LIVRFFEPPVAQRNGGLEAAIGLMADSLARLGVPVERKSTVRDLGSATGPEVAHFHGLWQPSFLRASAECRRSSIPYIVSPHGMLEPWAWRHKRWKKWPWFYFLERRHLDGAAQLLTTSDAEQGNLKRFLNSPKCCAIPLGMTSAAQPNYESARRSLGWNNAELVLLFLSRIHPKKGLELLLSALQSLDAPERGRLRLVIVGGGDEKYVSELKALIERKQNCLPRVDWVGEIWDDRKWQYLQGADLLCLPSYSENFGLVVLEALQVGTRVLTTDQTPWAAIPQWNGGFITTPTVEGVRIGLLRFLEIAEWSLAQRRDLAARIHSEYSWDKLSPRYVKLYDDVLATAAGRPTTTCV